MQYCGESTISCCDWGVGILAWLLLLLFFDHDCHGYTKLPQFTGLTLLCRSLRLASANQERGKRGSLVNHWGPVHCVTQKIFVVHCLTKILVPLSLGFQRTSAYSTALSADACVGSRSLAFSSAPCSAYLIRASFL